MAGPRSDRPVVSSRRQPSRTSARRRTLSLIGRKLGDQAIGELLLIVQSEWRVPLHEALKGRGGIILQQELTDRLIAELTAEQAESPPPG